MSDERKIHEFAKEPHRRWRTKDGLPPSDEAIAQSFWDFSHCQFHKAWACQFIEDILENAERITNGEPSWYDTETARYDAIQDEYDAKRDSDSQA